MTTESTMLDLSTLLLPVVARQQLANTTRQTKIFDHFIPMRPAWWATALTARSLPGGPVVADTSDEGKRRSADGRPAISRAQLFGLAAQATSDDSGVGALRLLWHTLAWGTGTGERNNNRRLDAVALDPAGAAKILREAGQLAATDPEAAFARLRPGRRNVVSSLGPAFFTKYLYFSGAGEANHRSLILDARVATALNERCGWKTLDRQGPWPAVTYARYCKLLADWAREAKTDNRTLAADELERWLFEPESPSHRSPTTRHEGRKICIAAPTPMPWSLPA